jgi:hypothetical protein
LFLCHTGWLVREAGWRTVLVSHADIRGYWVRIITWNALLLFHLSSGLWYFSSDYFRLPSFLRAFDPSIPRKKKAYVRLTQDYDALDVANRIGII